MRHNDTRIGYRRHAHVSRRYADTARALRARWIDVRWIHARIRHARAPYAHARVSQLRYAPYRICARTYARMADTRVTVRAGRYVADVYRIRIPDIPAAPRRVRITRRSVRGRCARAHTYVRGYGFDMRYVTRAYVYARTRVTRTGSDARAVRARGSRGHVRRSRARVGRHGTRIPFTDHAGQHARRNPSRTSRFGRTYDIIRDIVYAHIADIRTSRYEIAAPRGARAPPRTRIARFRADADDIALRDIALRIYGHRSRKYIRLSRYIEHRDMRIGGYAFATISRSHDG